MDRMFRLGFVLAGITNIFGILMVTKWMTSPTLRQADPAVFGDFGILMIMLWGLAYIGTADFASKAVLLPLAFAIEKAAYTINWAFWLRDNSPQLDVIRPVDPGGALFLQAYGLNDAVFGVFFLFVAIVNWKRSAT